MAAEGTSAPLPSGGEDLKKHVTDSVEEDEEHLLNYWYPVIFSKDLTRDKPSPMELYGEPLVLFRDEHGKPVCLQDRCAHRSAPLAIGHVSKGRIMCRYHGWEYDKTGACVRIPSVGDRDKIPKSVRVPSYPATERVGIVWVWPGDPEKCSLDRGFPRRDPEMDEMGNAVPGWRIYDQMLDQQYNWIPLIENLLDPSHLQFAHQGTQGRYIAPIDKDVPESTVVQVEDIEGVKNGFVGTIRTDKTIKPQNTKIFFEPPYTVRLEVTFGNGWRFFQNHLCVPMSRYRTRFFVRSMRDWLKVLPDGLIFGANRRVLRQDASILLAQQSRLMQGSSRWNYPVKADVLGMRFRHWVAKAEKNGPCWFNGYSGTMFKKGGGVKRVDMDDIEEVHKNTHRCGSGPDKLDIEPSPSMGLIKQVQQEAPELWKD